jgi:hypothetical protein
LVRRISVVFAFSASLLVPGAQSQSNSPVEPPRSAYRTDSPSPSQSPAPAGNAQTSAASESKQILNNDAIVRMVKAGLGDDIIVATIGASPGGFDTSANGLIALKGEGASDKVIAAIIAKNAGNAKPSVTPGGSGDQGSAGAEAPEAQNSAPEYREMSEPGTASGTAVIPPGSRIVIAPMGGFETYFAAAVREKKVPITLTVDKTSAQYFVVSTNTEWQGFVFGAGGNSNWTKTGGSSSYGAAGGSTRGLEASIMLISAKTKDVVWAYEVHKSSHGALLLGTFAARGQQSIAEACAKHLKEYIEKGK